MTAEAVKCKCGEPSDGWPGKDDGELCQMCWEAYCSETWWDAVIAIDIGLSRLTSHRDELRKGMKGAPHE